MDAVTLHKNLSVSAPQERALFTKSGPKKPFPVCQMVSRTSTNHQLHLHFGSNNPKYGYMNPLFKTDNWTKKRYRKIGN
uniref:Uncharacterized protein n=1 Tax=Romanomermis culicivorax TaxID=13658 RepID=A0A915JE16_ROMCU